MSLLCATHFIGIYLSGNQLYAGVVDLPDEISRELVSQSAFCGVVACVVWIFCLKISVGGIRYNKVPSKGRVEDDGDRVGDEGGL
jgi:hypothetical protein